MQLKNANGNPAIEKLSTTSRGCDGIVVHVLLCSVSLYLSHRASTEHLTNQQRILALGLKQKGCNGWGFQEHKTTFSTSSRLMYSPLLAT